LSSTSGFYDRRVIVVESKDTGVKQERAILRYDILPTTSGTQNFAVVDKDWNTTPKSGDTFRLVPDFRAIDDTLLVAGGIQVSSIT
jgi:hypothetical protein